MLPRQDLAWNQPAAEPEFAQFQDWVSRYQSADPATKRALEAEGIQIATTRREALRGLIVNDPERALTLAAPSGVQRAMPDSIRPLMEQQVSGRGSLDVFGALPEAGKEHLVAPTLRKASLNGRTYDAFVYGRRQDEPTRSNVALNGVAVDNLFAVNESPLRLLDPEEAASRLPSPEEAVCAVSGNPATITQTPVAADVGGETYVLCGPSHALKLNDSLVQAEIAADSGDSAGEGGGGPIIAASLRTEGTKRLLLIRVDFSDLAGAPFTDGTGTSLISGLNDFYMESSYGRSGFYLSGNGSTVTTTLRMPQTAAYYGGGDAFLQLRADARNAATTAGYTLGDYDYDLICFGAVPGWGWAGLGYVGASGVWLRSYFTPGVAGHELGHNYGLNHANYWDTGGQSVIGNGSSIEYGDNQDTMGAANAGAYHFNARYKQYMNWIRAGEFTNVTTSGIHRIYAHDDPTVTGLRALKIPRGASTNYWVELRQKFTSNKWLMSGAGIRWTGNSSERSHLLDTTPGSPDGKNDAALVLGRTFSDVAAGIHITTLRKGGTTPESLDVAVNIGTFPDNVAPTISVVAAGTNTSSGTPMTFTATASDANDDTLAYYWDFGDGTFGTNGAEASKTWTWTGEYVVRCVVSDMKGGEASDSVIVRVDNPGTYHISGTITANGGPVNNVRVSVSSMKVTYTDSDGTYTLAGLNPGSYTVSAALDLYDFSPVGFSNPITVGPNKSGINFVGEGGSRGTVSLTSPSSLLTYTAPASVSLAATATASSGQIVQKVEFYRDTTKLGEDTTSPYAYTWTSAPPGIYALTARSTDTAGLSVTSSPVNITINSQSPALTSQPQSQSVAAGANVTFTVGVSGTAPFAYRWRLNGTNLVGAVSSSLGLNNVQPSQAGTYSVVITNAAGAVTSAGATLVVTCSYTLSANSHPLSSVGGNGSVNVTTAGGCSWTVDDVPAWVTITSGNGGSGNGTVSYTVPANTNGSTRSATLKIAGRNYVISQGAPDLTRPTVTFSAPPANATITNLLVTVTGAADDNDGVARVDVAVGSGSFSAATGTESWSAAVTLSPGTNFISVRSVDLSGNLSLTNTRALFCTVPSSLQLAVIGQGSISGATNGQKFPIGKVCKITAVPVSGYVFSNWTGNVSGASPTLSFLMQSNLQVVANFVSNPFSVRKGAFNGLFYENDQVRLGRSGAFTFTLNDKGGYTAALQVGTKKTKASGKLGLDGRATNVVNRPGTNALTIIWSVALDGSDQITGTVSDGGWTADLLGDRAVFSKTNAAPQAGKYTLVLLGSPGGNLAPEGDSYGTASVDASGIVKVKGYLADKTTLAGKVPISKNGQWPFYSPLYGGKGAFLGWATFTNQSSSDFEGLVSWIKPAIATAVYHPDGFNSEAALLGSLYTAPVGNTNRILSLTNAVVLFAGGNLAAASTNDVVLGFGGKVTNASPRSLTMSFTLSSGLFSGSYTPEGATKAVPFKGVALQRANYAAGHFFGTNESGRVAIEAVPISPSARQLLLMQ